jgi:hypothetical protein
MFIVGVDWNDLEQALAIVRKQRVVALVFISLGAARPFCLRYLVKDTERAMLFLLIERCCFH